MMRNVDELSGADLDLWVARADGIDAVLCDPHKNGSRNAVTFYCRGHDGRIDGRSYRPSAHWSDGGPIIERENIQLGPPTQSVHRNGGPLSGWGESGMWSACTWHKGVNGRRAISHDKDSALVAAMRCYVKSKFGNEVEATKDTP